MKIKWILFFAVFLMFFQLSLPDTTEADSPKKQICVVLITGMGCSSCTKIEPVILLELTSQIPELVVLVYEIYESHKSNQPVFEQYAASYLSAREPSVIPFLVLGKKKYFRGEMEVMRGIQAIRDMSENMCPLPDGNSVSPMFLNLDTLPGRARIFTKNRVFIPMPDADSKALSPGTADTGINGLIHAESVGLVLKNMDFKETVPEPVYLSGRKILFQKAVEIGKWKLQWNE